MLTVASAGRGAGWASILLDVALVLGSGAETMGAIGAGIGEADGGDAISSGEGERREREGVVAAWRVWVVRGRGGGGEAGRGGGEVCGCVLETGKDCEDRAEPGKGGGRFGGAAEVGLTVLGGASLARTGSDTGAGVASINSRSSLSSSSSAFASAGGTVALAEPSWLWGSLAISSSCAPVMIFLWPRTSAGGRLRLTRRADLSTNVGSQKSSAFSSPCPRWFRTDRKRPLEYSLVTRREGVKSPRRTHSPYEKNERKSTVWDT